MSGTSMATPHVTGVAALYLDQVGDQAPQTVRDALVGAATTGVVTNAGAGSPNALLYSDFSRAAEPPGACTADGAVDQSARRRHGDRTGDVHGQRHRGDSDGTVTDVAFYGDDVLIGHDTSSPYSVTWSAVAAGAHRLTAIATDNSGAQATSPRSTSR